MNQQQQDRHSQNDVEAKGEATGVRGGGDGVSAGCSNDREDVSIVIPPEGEDVSTVVPSHGEDLPILGPSDLSANGSTTMDKPQPSSTLLGQEKTFIAYPRNHQQNKSRSVPGVIRSIQNNEPKVSSLLNPTGETSDSVGQDPASNGNSKHLNNTIKSVPGVARGLRNNQPKTGVLCHPTMNNTSSDNSNNSDCNHTKSVIRGLRNNAPKKDSKTFIAQQTRDLLSKPRHPSYVSYLDNEKPSYISYLDDGVEPSHNELPEEEENNRSVEVEVCPITEDQLENVLQHSPQVSDDPPTLVDTGGEANDHPPSIAAPAPTETTPGNNDDGLVEAMPVEDDHFASNLMEAEPVNQEALDQRSGRESRYQKMTRFGCGVGVAVAFVVLTVSLVIHQTAKKHSTVLEENDTLTPSPIRPMPPLENMELLYHSLPEKTKESLYNSTSPQYQAWEWLLNHPNITAYPEWRKKQVFALVTFYYSFGGSNWPDERPGHDKWMDETISECRWMLSEDEIAHYAQQSLTLFGPIYGLEVYRPCNEDGEIQWILVHHLKFPIEPVMPPEIALLTSLRILGIVETQKGGKFSDLFVPELIEHPSLEHISLSSAGFTGTIPTEVGVMTGLRHFVISTNKLTGTIPTEIAMMTSLEIFILGLMPSLSGRLPTEVGLMTSLIQLEVALSSLTGQIPDQIGSLTLLKKLNFWANKLTGSLPSQLGLLTGMTHLEIDYNFFTGTIPSELLQMTSMQRIWLNNNGLTGMVPSGLGLMTSCTVLSLGNKRDLFPPGSRTNFTGYLPNELWHLSNLEELLLNNLPNLHGSIPSEIFMPNLTKLSLDGSPFLAGTIPDQACSFIKELDFDCSNLLCGCDSHCQCLNATNYL